MMLLFFPVFDDGSPQSEPQYGDENKLEQTVGIPLKVRNEVRHQTSTDHRRYCYAEHGQELKESPLSVLNGAQHSTEHDGQERVRQDPSNQFLALYPQLAENKVKYRNKYDPTSYPKQTRKKSAEYSESE